MSDTALTLPAWLPPALREDPKKTMVLVGLVVVLLVFVGRCFIGGPPRAAASPLARPAAPLVAPARIGVKEPPSSGRSVRAWVKHPVTDVPRNLFLVRTDRFPRLTPAEAGVPQVRPTFWDAVEKSQAQRADEEKQRLILVQNLQREAAKLELQSTMMGLFPQAIISGTMVREGSLVAGGGGAMRFRVVKIEATDVIVEREGVQLRLVMPR